MKIQTVEYARHDGVSIAFQVFGSGPDLLVIPGWASHLERNWELPGLAERILARAVELGYTAMQFNAVVASNARAVHLWRSLGFTIVGTVPDAFRHPVHGLTDLHIMYRRL